MKLRILNNSVRLRLSQNDMDSLYNNKELIASCQLLNTTMHYSIALDLKLTNITADLVDQTILVTIPTSLFTQFYKSTDEGLYNDNKNELEHLKIAIERDFKCLTPRDEDESLLFPNPRESH